MIQEDLVQLNNNWWNENYSHLNISRRKLMTEFKNLLFIPYKFAKDILENVLSMNDLGVVLYPKLKGKFLDIVWIKLLSLLN